MLKKLFNIVTFTVTLLCVAIIMQSITFAAEKWPATSGIKTYVISTKNNTKVYKDAKSKDGSYGTIYADDLITIDGYSGSRFKVTYPIKNGTKTGYIEKSAVTNGTINKATEKWKATSKQTTYRRSGGGTELGYVSKGDVCYTIYEKNGYKQIIYPISGGYKMGWIKADSTITEGSGSLADVAANEVGYKSDGGDNTKYGKWIGANNQPWCASFVSWCVAKSGVPTKKVPKTANCNDMKSGSNSYHTWSENAINSIKKNDVIFFSEGTQDTHHVGIVYGVDKSKNSITLIEGNTSDDCVKKRTYSFVNKKLDTGVYGKLTWEGHYFSGYISVN